MIERFDLRIKAAHARSDPRLCVVLGWRHFLNCHKITVKAERENVATSVYPDYAPVDLLPGYRR